MNHSGLSDEKLFHLCRRYGTKARLWRQRFKGLLPEVNKRRLWEKKGFCSVFEFAKKLAGLSEEQVRLALNLEKNFSDRPVLKKMLTDGKVSLNKLARVVSVSTFENESFWANQVKMLPNRALETLVRDERNTKIQEQNGFQKPIFGGESLHVQIPGNELQLSEEVVTKLLELQQKGIDINEIILGMLEKREEEIEEKKEKISTEIEIKAEVEASRYIPSKIKKLLKEEHGTKCSIATCRKKAKTVHHTQRFSLSQNHNPYFLAPLCEEHHIIAHSIDQKFQEKRMVTTE